MFLCQLKIDDKKRWEKFFERQAAQRKQSTQENGPDDAQRILTSPAPIRRNTLYKARSLLEYVNISQQKGKPYGTEEKPKFDNARTVRGTYEIDPEDTEFKDTMKNERKKLEVRTVSAMPCKSRKTPESAHSKALEDRKEVATTTPSHKQHKM